MTAGGERVPLLTERVSDRLGLDRVAAALGHEDLGPYLVPFAGWVLDVVVLSGISYVYVGREQFEPPTLLLIPLGLFVAVALTRWVRDRYVAAVTNLPGDELDPTTLLAVPTGRAPIALYLALYAANFVHLALSPAEVAAFVAIHGEAVAYAKFVVASAFYFTVFADVLAFLIAGMVVLPWRLYHTDLSLDFSDVTGFAGLYETSRLLWAGTITYFVGLTAWTTFLLVPSMARNVDDVSPAETVLFPALWIVGVLLYLVPLLLLHRHMAREKERHVRRIDEEIRALDPDDADRGIPYLDPADDDLPRLQQKFIELQQVRGTREYPVNMAIVEELVLASLVPIALQWGVGALVSLG